MPFRHEKKKKKKLRRPHCTRGFFCFLRILKMKKQPKTLSPYAVVALWREANKWETTSRKAMS
jgi:hypothetical protein